MPQCLSTGCFSQIQAEKTSTQQTFTCSKSIIETLEEELEYVQS